MKMEQNLELSCNVKAALWKSSDVPSQRHSKVDLNKSDMLQLLSYLEGELQARDVVVATLQVVG